MHLASPLRHLPAALLAAALTLACGPKNTGDDAGGTTSGDTSSGQSSAGTTGAQECTPGDIKMSDAGDCSSCICSDQGTWDCNRCSPTSGPVETGTGATVTTDATTIAATTTGPATTDETTTSAPDSTTSTTSTTADTTTGNALGLPTCMDLSPSDNFTISGAKIVGDELLVDVGYSGGCTDHEFALCFDSIVLDTNLWNLAVDHDAHGDACEAFIMETRKFDLKPLQDVHESPLEFILLGFEGPSFKYEF